jgi:hypothetical protein
MDLSNLVMKGSVLYIGLEFLLSLIAMNLAPDDGRYDQLRDYVSMKFPEEIVLKPSMQELTLNPVRVKDKVDCVDSEYRKRFSVFERDLDETTRVLMNQIYDVNPSREQMDSGLNPNVEIREQEQQMEQEQEVLVEESIPSPINPRIPDPFRGLHDFLPGSPRIVKFRTLLEINHQHFVSENLYATSNFAFTLVGETRFLSLYSKHVFQVLMLRRIDGNVEAVVLDLYESDSMSKNPSWLVEELPSGYTSAFLYDSVTKESIPSLNEMENRLRFDIMLISGDIARLVESKRESLWKEYLGKENAEVFLRQIVETRTPECGKYFNYLSRNNNFYLQYSIYKILSPSKNFRFGINNSILETVYFFGMVLVLLTSIVSIIRSSRTQTVVTDAKS